MKQSNLSTTASTIRVTEEIYLRKTDPLHAEALFSAIDKNRTYLNQFLPWVAYTKVLSDTVSYLIQATENCNQGTELTYNIYRKDALVGRIGLHQIDHVNNNASVGYWLAEDQQGQGIISKACSMLLKIGFEDFGFHRIEILTATDNLKSSAIALRLGFTHEGVLRQLEKHKDTYLDLNIYSLLKHEWILSIK